MFSQGVVVVALLIIDMQVGLFNEPTPRYDADGVAQRIDAVAKAVRSAGGLVIYIQHDGPQGDTFEPGTEGWHIIPALEPQAQDHIVHKQACDAFYETELSALLDRHGVRQLILTGCATDFCVDTTLRAALSRDYEIMVVEDGHTTGARPHLDAQSVIAHHNWVWRDLIHPRIAVQVASAAHIVQQVQATLEA